MQIIGVGLHTRQQTVAMLNVETGAIVEKTSLFSTVIWKISVAQTSNG
jgi:hypothetical protein